MATWDWWSLPAPETEFAHDGGYRKNQPDWGEPDQHHHPPVAAPSFKAEDTGCDLDCADEPCQSHDEAERAPQPSANPAPHARERNCTRTPYIGMTARSAADPDVCTGPCLGSRTSCLIQRRRRRK